MLSIFINININLYNKRLFVDRLISQTVFKKNRQATICRPFNFQSLSTNSKNNNFSLCFFSFFRKVNKQQIIVYCFSSLSQSVFFNINFRRLLLTFFSFINLFLFQQHQFESIFETFVEICCF